jgi:hypothetical protein
VLVSVIHDAYFLAVNGEFIVEITTAAGRPAGTGDR